MLASLVVALLQHGAEPATGATEPPTEAARALAAIAVPEGWSAKVWAAEPHLANPVAFTIDDRGEVYVCETYRLHRGVTDMRDYMGWLDDELAATSVADRRAMFEKHLDADELVAWSTESERLRLVRDTDGDGVADEATIFAEGFSDLMDGIAAGVLKVDGDVYYTCIPHLWKLRDEDGDGVADQRQSLAEGFGVHVALLGHDLHGLVVGPDRRLYFSCGDRGMNLEPSGHDIVLPHEGAVLRCEFDGSNLEVVHQGLRNPQELVFDLHGDLFTGDNNSDGGDQARWVHVVPGGDSGWRHHYQYVTEPVLRGPWNAEEQWKPPGANQAAWLNPPIANLGAGPSGLDLAPGTGHPPELTGRFFLADFRGDPSFSGVWSFTLERKGAFFDVVDREEWLWKTLVTDFQFGPDGCAYWTDWVAGWGMTGKGRVFRMAWDGADAELVEETRALLAGDFDALEAAELERLLGHADRRVRQQAHFALADRGAEGVATLSRVAAGNPAPFARLHAIWGLWVAGKREPAAAAWLASLLDDADEDVRTQAVRVLGDLRVEGVAEKLVARLDDESARVRFHAALACARVKAVGARPALERMLVDAAATGDPNLRHAAVVGLAACCETLGTDPVPDDEGLALGRLLALRRVGNFAITMYLDAAPPLAIEAARAIYDDATVPGDDVLAIWAPTGANGESQEGSEARAKLLREPAFVRRVVAARLASPMPATALLEVASWDVDDAVRAEVLALVARADEPSPRDMISGAWHPLEPKAKLDLSDWLESPERSRATAFPGESDEVQLAWLDLVADMRRAPARRLDALEHFFGDAARSGRVRARALEAVVALHSDDASAYVDRALAADDAVLRAAALEALGVLEPADALARLGGVLTSGTLPERRAAYRVLAGLAGDVATGLIADELVKLSAGLVSPELTLDLVLAAEGNESPLIVSLLDAHRAAATLLDPKLAPYLDGLAGGDAQRGKRLFESTELSCLRCHSVTGDWSAQIGPSLHDVARQLPALEQVASIVDPNRRVARGFETELFFPLDDSPPIVGRVNVETPDSVQVIDAEGVLHDLSKSSIDVRRKDLSSMPEGLADSLSREEMRDLLAYLATLSESAAH
ncbi:MAG: HEAT repeat domain-containing protein [Planctomycetota bacterium]